MKIENTVLRKTITSTLVILAIVLIPRMVFAIDCSLISVEGVVVPKPSQIICPFLRVVNLALMVSGVALAVFIGYGAIKLSVSLGDPKGYEGAMRTFLFAIIGFFIVVGAFSLLTILNNTLGLQLGGNYDSASGLTTGIEDKWIQFLEATFNLKETAP